MSLKPDSESRITDSGIADLLTPKDTPYSIPKGKKRCLKKIGPVSKKIASNTGSNITSIE